MNIEEKLKAKLAEFGDEVAREFFEGGAIWALDKIRNGDFFAEKKSAVDNLVSRVESIDQDSSLIARIKAVFKQYAMGLVSNCDFNERIQRLGDEVLIFELRAENDRLRAALQYLYDEQNGAPLVRREKQWQAAMNEAEKLLKQ